MSTTLEVLTDTQIAGVHDATLDVLSRTGMRFASEKILRGLSAAGARVDFGARHAIIPSRLVETALESTRRQLDAGARLALLNGVTSARDGSNVLSTKLSGGCERVVDWERQTLREPTAEDLLDAVRLGERVPDIGFVGDPLVTRWGIDGTPLGERMRRICSAALIAKNTRKLGSMEIWDVREIDYLQEIGIVARGCRGSFLEHPCLLTAKETISPLFLDESAGDVLVALAERGLPCTVIPMPIAGLSAPVTPMGSVIIGNAEILGTLVAIRCLHPEALVGGGMISGTLDMATSAISFSAPEACLQDIALAEVHERLYGMDFLIGSGYTDAKYPSRQVLAEKTLKFGLAALSGRRSHPVGLINAGSAFSIEQALVDLEICRAIETSLRPLPCGWDTAGLVELIDSVGPRGTFISAPHTLEHFRDSWLPTILDRSGFESLAASSERDLYERAHAEARRLLGSGDCWRIEPEKAREIDSIVESARCALG